MSRPPILSTLVPSNKAAVSHAISWVESEKDRLSVGRLLDEAAEAAKAQVLGITGPPGVGKSTLTAALIRRWRALGDTVAVIAVDPSSRASGGALLGDRARMQADPLDRGVFIRSVAARDRLGGLSELAVAQTVLMRALYNRVIVETVGIGQSEADVALVADTVLLALQPGSGDGLQFMKAGVMELPDVVAVTKADLGAIATRARGEAEAALKLAAHDRAPQVLLTCASRGEGLDELLAALQRHADGIGDRETRRREQMRGWMRELLRGRFGEEGLAALAPLMAGQEPGFAAAERLSDRLREFINHVR